jgi:membrane fusion protein (multidrug efflux system)
MKKKIFGIICLIILAAIAAYVYFGANQNQAAPITVPPTDVKVATVQQQIIPLTANAMGTLIAPESIIIKSQQSGTVSGIYFKSGVEVKQGDLLLTLDNTSEMSAYLKAKAAMWQAEVHLQRYQLLADQSKTIGWAISKDDIDTAKSNYEQSKALLAQAEQNLDETKIYAPFDGALGVTNLAMGSYVQVGDDIVPIVNKQHLLVEYSLPETDYAYVKVGQQVKLKTDAYPDKEFVGIVSYIDPQVDAISRSFIVRATIDNKDEALSPGMLVSVTHVLDPSRSVMAIPSVSVVPEVSGYGVFVVQQNKANEVIIKIGQRYGDWVQVISGLKIGDQVVYSGQEKLSPGMPVNIVSGS